MVHSDRTRHSFVSPVYREQIQKEILSLRRKREFELARKAAVIAQSAHTFRLHPLTNLVVLIRDCQHPHSFGSIHSLRSL